MGVKSTILMTRSELTEYVRQREAELKDYSFYTDGELEDLAEALDEKAGNIFTNYAVVSEELAAKDSRRWL